ncbi:hypothetical protein BAUCODRAFT_87426 [Baudoinia panamericana UAMH 10762]|uniref:BAR domain-containing protein n=1 Tax=Baudoinia panamericana (strain UAMH 10762) TaxID=717646 RepID=M2LR72_BAUPA|nr:uncharacterized protein BAUCODRAFT_87426 [Baudoinia panamericana UAMH 10762]EMC96937.1 hypothetical protein BAUCODRAFT_87426 [Baudoinia panamericana UAMH 10762]
MSWTGFKKAASRAGTQVMMKTGHVEKTTDREYEVEERRYRTLESASLRLQKEAKGYLDSLRAMTASQMRIAETIDAFYGEAGAKDGVSRSYKQAVEDLDAETIKALDGPYRTTVLEPINRFCAYFPDINECIKKRNHKMLDYDAMRSKVKRLVEKPDKDPAKLPRTEKETEMLAPPSHTPAFLSTNSLPLRPNRHDEDTTPPTPKRRKPSLSHSPSMVADIFKLHKASRGGLARTPFFHPSELEQLMQPLRQAYVESQADELVQAKAAYEQLNEQLTNEIPQLIDLR